MSSDLLAILTGETNKGNLSASLLPANSDISSTYPAGWTLVDSDTGTSDEYVIRAPCDGDATQYKYVKFRVYTSGINRATQFSLMEDWDSGTNPPTNEVTQHSGFLVRTPVSTEGDGIQAIYIGATNRYIFIRTTGYYYGVGFPALEIDRYHRCLGVGNGYLPAVLMEFNYYTADNGTTYEARMPRIIDDAGTADITNIELRLSMHCTRPTWADNPTNFDDITEDAAYDDSSNVSYGIFPIYIERYNLVGTLIGSSEVSDIYMMQAGTLAGFEDQTTHTLDLPDDYRVVYTENGVDDGGEPRLLIKTE